MVVYFCQRSAPGSSVQAVRRSSGPCGAVCKASNGSVVQRWVQKSSHADNHYLDCEVYALAAADIQGVRTLHLQAVPEEAAPAPQPEQPTPEESWISQNEDWLQE